MRLLTSIIFAFYTNAGFALSLGEATLKSYLGESLTVKLSVTDVEKSPDISCFTITDANDTPAFKKALSTISSQKEGYLLTITTQSVISEPIVNLRVAYHCEPQLHRDYVLLLDPSSPIQDETASSNTASSAPTAATKRAIKKSNPTSSANTNDLDKGAASYATDDASNYAQPAKAKRKSKKRNVSIPSSADDKIMEAYVGKQQNNAKQAPATSEPSVVVNPNTSSKPYLSISGGSLATDASGTQHNLSLQFETQLDLNRAPPTTTPSSTDLQDEATMMSNRLAHLEKQIINLQAQNTLLKNEAVQAKNALAEQQSSGWFNYAWMIAATVLALVALEWLRRTIITRRLIKQELNWFDANEDTDSESTPLMAPIQPAADYKINNQNASADRFFDDDTDDKQTPVASAKSGILTPAENVNDEHDSIIDNADVFIEHDRPQLAIQLLQNHLNDFPTESPKVWLKLLSLLAKEGPEAEYTATVIEANKYFNIKAPDFGDTNNEDNSSIEDFSNIVARLEGAWGSPFAVKLLNDLIYDQYAQPAEGFSASNFEELFILKRIAELLNTGIAANQYTPHRNTTVKKAEHSSAAYNALDSSTVNSAAFNSDAFDDDNLFDNATASVHATKPKASTISDADFTVASLPEIPEQATWSKPTQEEMNAQFANSPFQKVPSYEVDMLANFDDHLLATAHTVGHAAEELNMATEAKTAPAEMAEEFLFPLDIYADETVPTEAATDETDNQAESKKGNDSNIIEWDLPTSNK